MVGILFVCMGNICRSPLAEGVFRKHAVAAGLADDVQIDSCGTISYHAGNEPDRRAQAVARQNGVDLSSLRARQLRPADYQDFDYLLAMDAENLRNMMDRAPDGFAGRAELFLAFAPELQTTEVPDPYYGGAEGFDHCYHLIDTASRNLIAHLRAEHGIG